MLTSEIFDGVSDNLLADIIVVFLHFQIPMWWREGSCTPVRNVPFLFFSQILLWALLAYKAILWESISIKKCSQAVLAIFKVKQLLPILPEHFF